MTASPAAELAVVIVNFNTGDYLQRCLASLEVHRGDIAVDVLVIDNASHDGSHKAAVAAHPRARLIENQENVFLSPAWNQGIRATDAPFVLLLNPDTEWWRGTRGRPHRAGSGTVGRSDRPNRPGCGPSGR